MAMIINIGFAQQDVDLLLNRLEVNIQTLNKIYLHELKVSITILVSSVKLHLGLIWPTTTIFTSEHIIKSLKEIN